MPDDLRSRVMRLADPSLWRSIPYNLPPVPNAVNVPNSSRQSIDCSLYILACFDQAGIPFSGVRTAEQIRRVCLPVGWPDVKLGDLLFFERTYQTTERATHIGISHGAGSGKMWDAHERSTSSSAVGLTVINPSSYWQDKIFEARRPPQYAADGPTPGPSVRERVLAELDASRARIAEILR